MDGWSSFWAASLIGVLAVAFVTGAWWIPILFILLSSRIKVE
jgi:hypothetical protein